MELPPSAGLFASLHQVDFHSQLQPWNIPPRLTFSCSQPILLQLLQVIWWTNLSFTPSSLSHLGSICSSGYWTFIEQYHVKRSLLGIDRVEEEWMKQVLYPTGTYHLVRKQRGAEMITAERTKCRIPREHDTYKSMSTVTFLERKLP